MDDRFHFGDPARYPARLGDPAPAHVPSTIDGRLTWIAAGLVVAAVLAFVFLRGADEAGRRIGRANSEAVSQIDRAHDSAAQATMGRVAMVAQSLSAERGSFVTDAQALAGFDPGLRFTSGPSTGPTSISYAVDAVRFGAAVRSESGTCWWITIDANGLTAYGSGLPCTGGAAMAASSPSW
jgi:hypothetical protein